MKPKSFVAAAAAAAEGAAAAAGAPGGTGAKASDAVANAHSLPAPPSTGSPTTCVVCKEALETYFDSDAERWMLRNAVALLKRMVDARVLAHGGPDGLERDARRIVQWYADLPMNERDMTLRVGMDVASGPDQAVTVTR